MAGARLAGMALAWALACSAYGTAQPAEQTVRIGVLSLFHPTELRLEAGEGCALQLAVEGSSQALSGRGRVSVVASSSDGVQVRLAGGGLVRGRRLNAVCVSYDARTIWLEVPGKLRRAYVGRVEIHTDPARARDGTLEAVVTMPLETAVASVVEAESPPLAGMEALKAQAVAARSFLVAHRTTHRSFAACDTTHCQFLRSPPAVNSQAERATRATAGLVLMYHDEVAARDETLAAMYARSCGGRTHSLREIGVRVGSGYPYYAVHCVYCSRHPETWRGTAGSPRVRNERDRLSWNRIHGWGAIPSLAANENETSPLEGRGVGHGVGLCQLGAADMARHGVGFAQILTHYYPNTRLTPMVDR
jgi:stage II sporulation protein D